MSFLNKIFLITGGTGTFGKAIVNCLLDNYKPKKVIVFSRDELKQFEMSNQENLKKNIKKLRFFIGDIRDLTRLSYAMDGVDYVIHAAALKQVPTAEYNPGEFIKTNIIGSQNVIDAAIISGVKKVISLSTDKAAAPINLYGATKLCSDKIFTSANNIVGSRKIIFSVVRYGNVMFSRGSVIPYFKKILTLNKPLPITDQRMTRFNITINESISLVLFALKNAIGGEIFIPKIPSYRINDLARALDQNCKIKIIGKRAGEKIHEELITSSDSYSTFDMGKYFVIVNPANEKVFKKYKKKYNLVPEGFSYNSGQNKTFLTVEKLKSLIKKNF
jgi:UDP-N-acetylglucosamine 4,6-dehydratase